MFGDPCPDSNFLALTIWLCSQDLPFKGASAWMKKATDVFRDGPDSQVIFEDSPSRLDILGCPCMGNVFMYPRGHGAVFEFKRQRVKWADCCPA